MRSGQLLRQLYRRICRRVDTADVSAAFGYAVTIVFVVSLLLSLVGTAGAGSMGTTDTSVVVEDEQGQPAADEPVVVIDPETDDAVAEETTDADGAVDVTLPPGDYEIETGVVDEPVDEPVPEEEPVEEEPAPEEEPVEEEPAP